MATEARQNPTTGPSPRRDGRCLDFPILGILGLRSTKKVIRQVIHFTDDSLGVAKKSYLGTFERLTTVAPPSDHGCRSHHECSWVLLNELQSIRGCPGTAPPRGGKFGYSSTLRHNGSLDPSIPRKPQHASTTQQLRGFASRTTLLGHVTAKRAVHHATTAQNYLDQFWGTFSKVPRRRLNNRSIEALMFLSLTILLAGTARRKRMHVERHRRTEASISSKERCLHDREIGDVRSSAPTTTTSKW